MRSHLVLLTFSPMIFLSSLINLDLHSILHQHSISRTRYFVKSLSRNSSSYPRNQIKSIFNHESTPNRRQWKPAFFRSTLPPVPGNRRRRVFRFLTPTLTRPATAFSRSFSLPEYLFGNLIYCRDGGDGQWLPDCDEWIGSFAGNNCWICPSSFNVRGEKFCIDN